jgi:nucleotidyltransferase/DNA polymerase involved in DNA repair
MDVTGVPEPLIKIAEDLQKRVNQETGLPISIGGATNKLIAKIANDWGKSQNKTAHPPNAITIVTPGEEADFLAPLPVQSLWGVGPKTAKKLVAIGINTIGKLAKCNAATLEMLFGQYGFDLQRRAKGIDKRPIEMEHDVKSVSNEVTFARDLTDKHDLLLVVRQLSEQVGRRLRRASLAGSTIQIKLRWSDFTTITRQTTLSSPTNLDQEIYNAAVLLFNKNRPAGKPVRLVGVGVSNLGAPIYQLSLWEDDHQKKASLVEAMDSLRERYGNDIILRADQLHQNGKKTFSKESEE